MLYPCTAVWELSAATYIDRQRNVCATPVHDPKEPDRVRGTGFRR